MLSSAKKWRKRRSDRWIGLSDNRKSLVTSKRLAWAQDKMAEERVELEDTDKEGFCYKERQRN